MRPCLRLFKQPISNRLELVSHQHVQEYIKDPKGSELSPASGSQMHGASRLEQLRIEHAPNAAFLTVAATCGLSASSQPPGRLHFTVPSLASPDIITLLGFPGLNPTFPCGNNPCI